MSTISLYKTTTMLPAVEKLPPLPTYILDTFFPGFDTFVTESVMFDYYKGGQLMAPFVAPRVGGITVARDGYKTKQYTSPKIAPQRVLTSDHLEGRAFGENIFSTRTPAQRQADILLKDAKYLDDMITRRIVWMGRELLLGNTITVKGYIDRNDSNYVEDSIDFEFTQKTTLTGTAKWTDAGSSGKKIENLETYRDAVIESVGEAPKMAIFGKTALKEFLKDSQVKELLVQVNAGQLVIKPQVQANGVTYIGYIPQLDLEIYTYGAQFVDDDGVKQPFIPNDKVILANANIGKVVYGAVTQMEKDGQFHTYEGKRVPKVWDDQNADARMIRLTSRPIPVPHDVDAWYVATVL